MKKTLLTLLILLTAATAARAKKQQVPHVYMFGMAASFTDTIVHFTNVQTLDSAWIDQKTKFLLERDAFSYQLRDYLEQKEQMPHRTCVVFFALKREKLEKKYKKMMKLYGQPKKGRQHFDLRHISPEQFQFTAIDLSDDEAETETTQPAPKHADKKREKHGRKQPPHTDSRPMRH